MGLIESFQFATAQKIIFGRKRRLTIPHVTADWGSNVFILTVEHTDRLRWLFDLCKDNNLTYDVFSVTEEPTVEMVEKAMAKASRMQPDWICAVGGGSVMDTGKALATMLVQEGDLTDYLEVIGKGKPLKPDTLPLLAVPTTAGTGSEVTKNAVLKSQEYNVKVSMRSDVMLPKVALVDPELTTTLPPEVTATTGLDAITQLLEAYVSRFANPLTDAICLEGLRYGIPAIKIAYENGQDIEAREKLSVAALFSGLALANAKLGAVHGFAGPLGGMVPAPHGAICARLLPLVVDANYRALVDRGNDKQLKRFEAVARIINPHGEPNISLAVEKLHDLVAELNIPGLESYGFTRDRIDELVDKASQSSSMKGNPIELERQELESILDRAR
ncbi:iron-containing alcohol dehydrogenase [candidate division KSB1 bacterium]|nr:iron-containing alcohol dehydrogenase [candidate division KSB1 bacterium]